jgi:nitrogen regulatory protein PII
MHIMKMITAVVRPFKLDELRQAIAQLGVQGVTVTEVYEAQFGPRAKVEIAVDDAIVEPVSLSASWNRRSGYAPAKPAPPPPEHSADKLMHNLITRLTSTG